MASSNYFFCLLGAMDRLWFHQIILLSQPTSLQNLESTTPSPSLYLSPLDNEELSSVGDEENLSESPPNSTDLEDDYSDYEEEQDDDEEQEEEYTNQKLRPTRSNLTAATVSSPLAEKFKDPTTYSRRRLQKSMSCMGELELEEVKGFMDLGFVFEKEHMSPRMMSLLPGLQRLGVNKNKQKADDELVGVGVEDEEKTGTMRPYLSEAWLIKKPNSALLNLRIPKLSAAADMKKHLRSWAKTVASEIQ